MPKTAFLFPGQGSQKPGMGRELAENFDSARRIFEEADAALGFPISKLCFEGPEQDLKLTENTQPAILTCSVATLAVIREKGLEPDFVAGHSLGEYTALAASGVISFADAVQTVRQRGLFMEEAVPAGQGTMAAVIGADRETVDRVCREVSEELGVVEPANYNCPGQLVISGEADAVKAAGEKMMTAGARRVISLSVSGPFHSSLMKPAADRMEDVLGQLDMRDAAVPIVTNVFARPEWVAEGQFTFGSGLEAAERLLGGSRRPTAIFAANDDMALGVLQAAAARGLGVPRDLSVAGFDDTPSAVFSTPPLTTIRHPVAEMAAAAAQRLIPLLKARLDAEDGAEEIVVSHALMIRGSTAPPARPSA